MNLTFRQPSTRRLERWLDTKPAKFERYLIAHPEIEADFESASPLAAVMDSAREAMGNALAAPLDFAARIRERLTDDSRETSTLAVVIDLAGVGPSTLRLLAGPLIDHDD